MKAQSDDRPAPRLRHAALAGGAVVVCGAVVVGVRLLANKVFGWNPGTGALIIIVLGALTVASAAAVGLVIRRSPELTLQVLGFRRPTLRILHLLWQIPVTFIAAALLAAGIFAAVHIAPPALAYVFVIGLSACLLLRFHGNLWAPIILHMVNNSVVVLAGSAAVL